MGAAEMGVVWAKRSVPTTEKPTPDGGMPGRPS